MSPFRSSALGPSGRLLSRNAIVLNAQAARPPPDAASALVLARGSTRRSRAPVSSKAQVGRASRAQLTRARADPDRRACSWAKGDAQRLQGRTLALRA